MRLVPFDYRVTKNIENSNLAESIIETESAGVLNWLLEGAKEWYSTGFKLPACSVIDTNTDDYIKSNDELQSWLDERTTTIKKNPKPELEIYTPKTKVSILHADFIDYSGSHIKRQEFSKMLESKNIDYYTRKNGSKEFYLELKNDTENDSKEGGSNA